MYGFVPFRYVNGQDKETFAQLLKESSITVWNDPFTDFGISALEAMACGNIVIGKIPEHIQEWMLNENGDIRDNAIWFDSFETLPDILAQVIGSWMQDDIPEVLYNEMKKTNQLYTKENYINTIQNIMDNIILNRINELNSIKYIKGNKNNEEEIEGEEK
jgi:glycosyltransferase involved in cell wall biosynthesis